MQYVKSHVTRTHDSKKRIHVGTVVIEQTPAAVNQFRDFEDFFLEEPQGVRIRHHDSRHIVAQQRLQILNVHQAIGIGFDDDDIKATDGCAGRIGAVSAVWDYHLSTFGIPPKQMILAHYHEACQLSVSACAWIEREMSHPCQFCEGFVHLVIYLKSTLHGRGRLQRMQALETFHPGNLFIYLRIVLHRAAAKRIETGIYAEIHLRQVSVVTHDIHLAHLRQRCRG